MDLTLVSAISSLERQRLLVLPLVPNRSQGRDHTDVGILRLPQEGNEVGGQEINAHGIYLFTVRPVRTPRLHLAGFCNALPGGWGVDLLWLLRSKSSLDIVSKLYTFFDAVAREYLTPRRRL